MLSLVLGMTSVTQAQAGPDPNLLPTICVVGDPTANNSANSGQG